MDFSIPEDLRSLRREPRRLIDTEVTPFDGVFEEEDESLRRHSMPMRPESMAGSGSTCQEIAFSSRKWQARTSPALTVTALNTQAASKGLELHGSQIRRRLPNGASGRAAATLIGSLSPTLCISLSALGAHSCECPFALAVNH
jgi:alkylation response protein AidB-like acyl-CoA dehydrogenase